MLHEKVLYQDGLPININVANITEYPLHFHKDIEIIYVLEGSLDVKRGRDTYRLIEDDIFILNGREIHGLYSRGGKNSILMLQLNTYFFSKYFEDLPKSFFVSFVENRNDERFEAMRTVLCQIMLEMLTSKPGYINRIIEKVNYLLAYTHDNFHYFSLKDGKIVDGSNRDKVLSMRLKKIIDYIYENHRQKISLKDLSETVHLSTYYLSHVIKDNTGMSFRDFLCYARLDMSEMDLLGSDKKISLISQEAGFSAVRYYKKYFKKWFGMEPEQYREKYRDKVKSMSYQVKMDYSEPEIIRKLVKRQLLSTDSETGPPEPLKIWSKEVTIDPLKPSEEYFSLDFIPDVDLESLDSQGDEILSISQKLGIEKIRVTTPVRRENIEKYTLVAEKFYREKIRLVNESGSTTITRDCFGWDSMAYIPCLLKTAIDNKGRLHKMNSMIDGGDPLIPLKGMDGIMTSGLVPKPSFYGCKMLYGLKGRIISRGDNHIATVSTERSVDSIRILLFTSDSQIEKACNRKSTTSEIIELLENHGDEMNISIRLQGMNGDYRVLRYSINNKNSLMNHVAKTGFSKIASEEDNELYRWMVTPKINISTISGDDTISVNMKGITAEMIMLDKIK